MAYTRVYVPSAQNPTIICMNASWDTAVPDVKKNEILRYLAFIIQPFTVFKATSIEIYDTPIGKINNTIKISFISILLLSSVFISM